MRIIHKELRLRALKAYSTGRYTQSHLAEVYGVTRKTISNWLRIERTEGRVEPLPKGHRRESFTDEEKVLMVELIKAKPDLTLEQIRSLLDKDCTLPTVHNALRRLGCILKKLSGPASKGGKTSSKRVVPGRDGSNLSI
jgi:transposase